MLIINKKNVKIRKILATKVKQRTQLLNKKNNELKNLSKQYLQEKNIAEFQTKEILKSISYASTIQKSLFKRPVYEKWAKNFNGQFLIFKPRDKVSGDFYWASKKEDNIFIAIGDCTGHGVPGAMISILGTSLLNEVIQTESETNRLLDNLREKIILHLSQRKKITEEKLTRDGMDISLLKINLTNLECTSSSAYNPVYIVRNKNNPLDSNLKVILEDENNILYSTYPDKQPVGIFEKMKPFTECKFKLIKNDSVFLFSDGYQDQFGGEKNKKFLKKNFNKLLLSIHNNSSEKQKEILLKKLNEWKVNADQTDDITIFGLKI